MEISITGSDVNLKDARCRVRVIGAVTKMICEELGEDPAEGTMMLLTAAAMIVLEQAIDRREAPDILADALGNAIIVAKDWSRKAA